MNTLPKLVEKKSGSAIRTMFSAIAPRYDLLNHILSCNRDIAWRKFAAKLVPPDVERVLDVCAGTGDLGLALLHRLSGDTESRNPSVVAILQLPPPPPLFAMKQPTPIYPSSFILSI